MSVNKLHKGSPVILAVVVNNALWNQHKALIMPRLGIPRPNGRHFGLVENPFYRLFPLAGSMQPDYDRIGLFRVVVRRNIEGIGDRDLMFFIEILAFFEKLPQVAFRWAEEVDFIML